MNREHAPVENPQLGQAAAELEGIIRRRFPEAQFTLVASPEEPETVHLLAEVEMDDPDEVLDLVLDRVLEFQIEQGLPLHVIPLRSAAAGPSLGTPAASSRLRPVSAFS